MIAIVGYDIESDSVIVGSCSDVSFVSLFRAAFSKVRVKALIIPPFLEISPIYKIPQIFLLDLEHSNQNRPPQPTTNQAKDFWEHPTPNDENMEDKTHDS